jgi:hypothetical protein
MVAPVATNGEDEMSEATDFDFLQGEWNSRQRRRREWLAGSDEWDEFEATIAARPILDGLGTVEEFRTDYAGGFVGVTFRFFDPARRQWSIYWADTRYPALLLAPPVIGSFSGDVGVFECDDTFEGRPIRVRYS